LACGRVALAGKARDSATINMNSERLLCPMQRPPDFIKKSKRPVPWMHTHSRKHQFRQKILAKSLLC
jgi:hypothetical protein